MLLSLQNQVFDGGQESGAHFAGAINAHPFHPPKSNSVAGLNDIAEDNIEAPRSPLAGAWFRSAPGALAIMALMAQC